MAGLWHRVSLLLALALSLTATSTPTSSPTGSSSTSTSSRTRTPTASGTASSTPAVTRTASSTPTNTPSPSVTPSNSPTASVTPSSTATATGTSSITSTASITPSSSSTGSVTAAATATSTTTGTQTSSATSTATPTSSATATATPTSTQTPSATRAVNAPPVLVVAPPAVTGPSSLFYDSLVGSLEHSSRYLVADSYDAAADGAWLNVSDPDRDVLLNRPDPIRSLVFSVPPGSCSGLPRGGGSVALIMALDRARLSSATNASVVVTPWDGAACALRVTCSAKGGWNSSDVREVIAALFAALSGPLRPLGTDSLEWPVSIAVTDDTNRREDAVGRPEGRAPNATALVVLPAGFAYHADPPLRYLVELTPSAASAQTAPQLAVLESAPPTPLFPTLNATLPRSSPDELLGFSLALDVGCFPGDSLALPPAAVAAFNVAAPSAALPTAAPIVLEGCPMRFSHAGRARSGAYVALLRAATFKAARSNGAPANAMRLVALAVGSLRSGPPWVDTQTLVAMRVQPVNDVVFVPAALPGALRFPENTLPLLEVTIAQECTGRVAASMAPGTSVCLVDLDPVLIPRLAGAGASENATRTGLWQVSSYSLTLTLSGAPPPLLAPLLAAPTIVGAPVTDCAVPLDRRAAAANANSAVVPCWRAQYALASSAPDLEALRLARADRTRDYSLALRVTDTFELDNATASRTLESGVGTIKVTVDDANDAPTLGWRDDGVAGSARRDREVLLDEGTNTTQAGYEDVLAVWDQDESDHADHVVSVVGVSPPDGAPALNGRSASELFSVQRVSTTATPVNATFVSFYRIVPTSYPLAALPAKVLALRLEVTTPARGASAPTASMLLSVRVQRANNAVSLGPATFTTAENTAIGAVVGAFSATDVDVHQALTYRITGTASGREGLYALRPIFSTTTCFDAATNATRNVTVQRGAQVVVVRDALDYEDAGAGGARSVTLQVTVEDDASHCTSALAKPRATSAQSTVTVALLDAPDAPSVTRAELVPPAGLSAGGGQAVELVGTGLGLSDAGVLGGRVDVSYSNGVSSLAFVNCSVVERLVRVRCVTAPGFGSGFTVQLTVGGQPPAVVLASVVSLAYEAPRAVALEATATNLTALPTGGSSTTFSVVGPGFTSDASVAANSFVVTLLGGGARNVNRVNVSGCLRQVPAVGAPFLSCPAPEGAGAGLAVAVSLHGATGAPPTVSYAAPSVSGTSVAVSADGAPTLTLAGANLGTRATLDWVRYAYAAQPALLDCPWSPTGECLGANATAAPRLQCGSFRADCRMMLTTGCVFTAPHTDVTCQLDAAGWGEGLVAQVSVGGQMSSWSAAPFAYPPPSLDAPVRPLVGGNRASAEVTPFEVAKYLDRSQWLTPAEPVLDAVTYGGSLLHLIGTGLSLNASGELRLTIGGVSVPVDSIARAPDGRFRVLATAPAGFGNVSVVLGVGRRNATSWLVYQHVSLRDGFKGSGTPSDSGPKSFRIIGHSLSRCAFQACLWPAPFRASRTVRQCGTLDGCALPADVPRDPSLASLPLPSSCLSMRLVGSDAADTITGVDIPQCPFESDPLPERSTSTNTTFESKCGRGAAGANFTERDDSFCVTTSVANGTLTVSQGGVSSSYQYSLASLVDIEPQINQLVVLNDHPNKRLYTTGGDTIEVYGQDAGQLGSIIIEGKIGPDWAAMFECPMVWGTRMYRPQGGSSLLYGSFEASNRTRGPPGSKEPAVPPRLLTPGWEFRTVYLTDWVVLPEPLPCHVVSYVDTEKQVGYEDQAIKVVAPAWVGRARVKISSKTYGKQSKPIEITYAQPQLDGYEPLESVSSTGDAPVTLVGRNFGVYRDVVDLLAAYEAQRVDAAIEVRLQDPAAQSAYKGFVTATSPPRGTWVTAISFRYNSFDSGKNDTADELRPCSFDNSSVWTDSLVTCRPPRSVPGSTSTLVMQQPEATDLFADSLYGVRCSRPVLSRALPRGAAVAGGNYTVRLEGSLFSLACVSCSLSPATPSSTRSASISLSATASPSFSPSASGTLIGSSQTASATASASIGSSPTGNTTASASIGSSQTASVTASASLGSSPTASVTASASVGSSQTASTTASSASLASAASYSTAPALNASIGSSANASASVTASALGSTASLRASPSSSAFNASIVRAPSAVARLLQAGNASVIVSANATASVSASASNATARSGAASATSTGYANISAIAIPAPESPSAIGSSTATPSATLSLGAIPSGTASASVSVSASGSGASSSAVSPSAMLSSSSSPSATLSRGAAPSGTASASASASASGYGAPSPGGSSAPSPSARSTLPRNASILFGTDQSRLWSVKVVLTVPDSEGRLGRLPEAGRPVEITYSDDSSLEFVMPAALGVINVQLQFSRLGLSDVELAQLLSNPVFLAINAPVITSIVTEAPAEDPCTLLREVAALQPCEGLLPATSSFVRQQALAVAIRACYPASGFQDAPLYAVGPARGRCERLQSNSTTNSSSSGSSSGSSGGSSGSSMTDAEVAVGVSDAASGETVCTILVHRSSVGGSWSCNATAPACVSDAAGPPVCIVDGTSSDRIVARVVERSSTAEGGRLVCSVTLNKTATASAPGGSFAYDVPGCAATVGVGGAFRGTVASLPQPCGMRSRRVIGTCHMADVQAPRLSVGTVLAQCLQLNASALSDKRSNTSLVVSEGSTDAERVSACALVDTLVEGHTAAPGFLGRIAPAELRLLTDYRAGTYCWPRFPLDSARDSHYASCVKANVPTRTLLIKGAGFGDRLARVVASVGNATDRFPCKQPEIRSDAEIRCELENATALPIGDLTAEIRAYGGADDGVSAYYRVNSGNQTQRAVIRSLCRLGTRFVALNSAYFAASSAAAAAATDATDRPGACVECDPTAYKAACLGGDGALVSFFRPRAQVAYWRTDAAEWGERRNLQTAVVQPDDFVQCAVPELCLSNQVCVKGTSDWMCTRCAVGWARGLDGVCTDCSFDAGPTESLMGLVISIVLTLLLLRVAYGASAAVRAAVDPAFAVVTCARCRTCRSSSPEVVAAAPKAPPQSTQPQPAVMIYLKVFLGYSQGLSAINALLQSSRAATKLAGVQPGDAQLVPNALVAASVFGELGLSTRQVSCVFAEWTRRAYGEGVNVTKTKARVFMLLPLALIGLAPVILGVAALVRWALGLAAAGASGGAHALLASSSSSSSSSSTDSPAAGEPPARSGGGGARAPPDSPVVSTGVNPMRRPARGGGGSEQQQGGAAAAAPDAAAQAAGGPPAKPAAAAGGGSLSYAVVLGIYLSLGPSIAAMARLLSCEEPKKGGFLRDDPSQSCFEPDFLDIQQNAITFGNLYLVLPLLVGLFLSLPLPGDVKRRLPVVFLLEAYREYPWPRDTPFTAATFLRALRTDGLWLPSGWETFALFRKGLLMATASAFIGTKSTGSKVTTTMFILLVSLLAQIFVSPFSFPIINVLEACALLGQTGFTASALGRLFEGAAATTGFEKTLFDIFSLAFNVPFVFLFVGHLADRALSGGTRTDAALRWFQQRVEAATTHMFVDDAALARGASARGAAETGVTTKANVGSQPSLASLSGATPRHFALSRMGVPGADPEAVAARRAAATAAAAAAAGSGRDSFSYQHRGSSGVGGSVSLVMAGIARFGGGVARAASAASSSSSSAAAASAGGGARRGGAALLGGSAAHASVGQLLRGGNGSSRDGGSGSGSAERAHASRASMGALLGGGARAGGGSGGGSSGSAAAGPLAAAQPLHAQLHGFAGAHLRAAVSSRGQRSTFRDSVASQVAAEASSSPGGAGGRGSTVASLLAPQSARRAAGAGRARQQPADRRGGGASSVEEGGAAGDPAGDPTAAVCVVVELDDSHGDVDVFGGPSMSRSSEAARAVASTSSRSV